VLWSEKTVSYEGDRKIVNMIYFVWSYAERSA
jgi:hypothetical protein